MSPSGAQAYLDFVLINITLERGHRHHILPRCIFPQFSCLKDFPWNEQILSKEDHIAAHQLLVAAFPTSYKLKLAFNLMAGNWLNSKGLHRIFRLGEEKRVPQSKVKDYLDCGWTLGGRRKGHRWTFKTNPHSLLIGRGNTCKKPNAPLNSPSGYHWYNDGQSEWMLPPEDVRVSTLIQGKLSTPALGKVWINNGVEDQLAHPENIPEGFTRGRIWTPNTRGRVWVHRGTENRSVCLEEVDCFLADEFELGMAPVDRSHATGTTLINNGLVELRVKKDEFSPLTRPGFTLGRLEENKVSATREGYCWLTNGEKNIQLPKTVVPPDGFLPGKCEHHTRKPYPTGKKWYTNETEEVQVHVGQVAPKGFRAGRLGRKKGSVSSCPQQPV